MRAKPPTLTVPLALLLAGALGVSPSEAKPRMGGHCASCHNVERASAMELTGTEWLDVPGRGKQRVFQTRPGELVSITAEVQDGHNTYGLSLEWLGAGGLLDPDHRLLFTPDADWTAYSDYTYIHTTSSWPATWTYDLQLDAATPPDWYALRLSAAGKNGGKWADAETFYVWVSEVPEPRALPMLGFAAILGLAWRAARRRLTWS